MTTSRHSPRPLSAFPLSFLLLSSFFPNKQPALCISMSDGRSLLVAPVLSPRPPYSDMLFLPYSLSTCFPVWLPRCKPPPVAVSGGKLFNYLIRSVSALLPTLKRGILVKAVVVVRYGPRGKLKKIHRCIFSDGRQVISIYTYLGSQSVASEGKVQPILRMAVRVFWIRFTCFTLICLQICLSHI